MPGVEEWWCREGVREGTQRYHLRLETALVLLCRFLSIGVGLREARGNRKGEGVRAWGWGEARRLRFPPALLLCSLLGLYLSMERARNVLLDVLYSDERLTCLRLSILSRGETFDYRKLSCGNKLARLCSSLRRRVIFSTQKNIPFKRIFFWPIEHDSADYLTQSIFSYSNTLLH